jgi:DNA-binding transcriptional LysR family regulator
MISLKQMKYFTEVVDAGSYSRAAESLYVAQSALSRQIKELEGEVQAQLLRRDPRQVELTDAGRLFYERSKRILQDVAETVALTQRAGQGALGTVRLLHSSSVTITSAMGAALHRLLDAAPGLALEVSKASSDQQAADIAEGRADLGLARLPILRRHPGIVVREVGSEALMVAVAASHPLAARNAVDLASLREEAFVSLPHRERGGLSYLVAGLCVGQGFYPKVARATSRKTSLLNLVEAGFGIAIVPASMREVAPQGVRFIALSDQTRSSIALIMAREPGAVVANFAAALEAGLAALF